jgi:hypothetical protein
MKHILDDIYIIDARVGGDPEPAACNECRNDLDEYLSTDRTNMFWENCCNNQLCSVFNFKHNEMRCSEHQG